jgi:hypothetical protein
LARGFRKREARCNYVEVDARGKQAYILEIFVDLFKADRAHTILKRSQSERISRESTSAGPDDPDLNFPRISEHR